MGDCRVLCRLRVVAGTGNPRGDCSVEQLAELETLKRQYEAIFLDKCSAALSPFAPGGKVSRAGLRGMLGAAEALSQAAASGELSREEAQRELLGMILGMVGRQ